MKKNILSLLLTSFLSFSAFSQVTLEHSYTSFGGGGELPQDFIYYTDRGINYYTLNSNNQLLLYNSSHELYKTIALNIGSDYRASYICLMTDKLFNSDSKIEFIVSSYGNSSSKMTLFNEDGMILYEFGDGYHADVVRDLNMGYKLIVMKAGDDSSTTFYDVYTLSGTLSVEQQEVLAKSSLYSFPNPAVNKMTINTDLKNGETGNLEVFDSNGKKVLEKKLPVTDNKVEIDVTTLTRGVYIYRLNGKSNKFIKE